MIEQAGQRVLFGHWRQQPLGRVMSPYNWINTRVTQQTRRYMSSAAAEREQITPAPARIPPSCGKASNP